MKKRILSKNDYVRNFFNTKSQTLSKTVKYLEVELNQQNKTVALDNAIIGYQYYETTIQLIYNIDEIQNILSEFMPVDLPKISEEDYQFNLIVKSNDVASKKINKQTSTTNTKVQVKSTNNNWFIVETPGGRILKYKDRSDLFKNLESIPVKSKVTEVQIVNKHTVKPALTTL